MQNSASNVCVLGQFLKSLTFNTDTEDAKGQPPCQRQSYTIVENKIYEKSKLRTTATTNYATAGHLANKQLKPKRIVNV